MCAASHRMLSLVIIMLHSAYMLRLHTYSKICIFFNNFAMNRKISISTASSEELNKNDA